jgi:hypothetical protein
VQKKSKHIAKESNAPFEADKDYFKSLEDKIFAKTIGDSYHLAPDILHPFVTPKGYLETLDASIMSRTSVDSFILEANVSHPFLAPNGYLENLETQIFSKTFVKAFELKENIKYPFHAPKGYLEGLDANVYSKTTDLKPIKSGSGIQVVWRNYGQFIRIAATVLIAGLFALGIYINSQYSTTEKLTLSELNTDDIYAYLDEQNLRITDFETFTDEFSGNSFSDIHTSEMDALSEDELIELIDFQFTNDI